MTRRVPRTLLAILALAVSASAAAEPYLAVFAGQKCGTCHVNPTGGGKRTAYGAVYGQSELSREFLEVGGRTEYLTGEINRWLAVGGDYRGRFSYTDIPNQDSESDFDTERATLYAELRLIPGFLSLYIDEQVAPGSATSRELYALLTPANGRYTLKAGKFFLPYGLRLEDDTAFIRQATGINFDTPDNGVEAGLELGPWSAQLALTNGTSGAAENDSGKQLSGLVSYVRSRWRVGASLNFNDADAGDRRLAGMFVGLRTGPVAWLAEVDWINDEGTTTGERDLLAGLAEGNWRIARGHNLKLTYEYFDPDDDVDEDEQTRYSVVWEYSPVQFTQLRVGARIYDGIPQNDLQNRDEAFAELHVYF